MKNKLIIPFATFNFEHDSSMTFEHEGVLHTLEFERIVRNRYHSWADPVNYKNVHKYSVMIRDGLLKHLGVSDIEITNAKKYVGCHWAIWDNDERPDKQINYLLELMKVKNISEYGHHESHAAGAYALSGFDEALIFSFDGGGIDVYERDCANWTEVFSYTKVYHASKETGLKVISDIKGINLGWLYIFLSFYPDCVTPSQITDMGVDELKLCGKFMGLSGHSSPNALIVKQIVDDFFSSPMYYRDYGQCRREDFERVLKFFPFNDEMNYLPSEENLWETPNNPAWNIITSFEDSAEFASNWQEAFEQIVITLIEPYVLKHDIPICLTGGVALNVLLNERIRKVTGQEVFVPPNPGDCGLTTGAWFLENWDKIGLYDSIYSNWDILDRDLVEKFKGEYNFENCGITKLSTKLISGEIIGVVNGQSECGPRALGNRSILCDPSIPDMKDILNSKVKHREWYRPFAPVVRYEDRNKYFHFDGDSPYMSFATQVRAKYQEQLQAVTHVDGSARIQTVKREQNEFLYDLLTEMEKIGKIPVLLNTSFNIKGNPILTTIKDALHVLDSTELDAVYVEGTLFTDRR